MRSRWCKWPSRRFGSGGEKFVDLNRQFRPVKLCLLRDAKLFLPIGWLRRSVIPFGVLVVKQVNVPRVLLKTQHRGKCFRKRIFNVPVMRDPSVGKRLCGTADRQFYVGWQDRLPNRINLYVLSFQIAQQLLDDGSAVKTMTSRRREQDDKPDLAFVLIEVSRYVSNVGRVFETASKLISCDTKKTENQSCHHAYLDISSFCHIASTADRTNRLRRAGDRAIGTINTTVAGQRLEHCLAALTFPEENA